MNKYQRGALFVWFYVGWFGCVLLAKSGDEIFTPLFPLVGIFLLFKFKSLTPNLAKNLAFLAIVGILFDFTLNMLGWIRFEPASVLPIWLVSLWFLFASLLPLTKNLFGKRYAMAAALGALFGPLSYKSGEAFGVLYFESPAALPAFALFWAAFFPFSLYLLAPETSREAPVRQS